MEISPYLLFCLLVSSVAFGGTLGVLHDVHRMIRMLFGVRYGGKHVAGLYARPLPLIRRRLEEGKADPRPGRLLPPLLFVQDIVWFCTAGCGVVLLNFYYNNGRFRLYTVLGLIAGFLLYSLTLGRLVLFCSEGILFFVRAFLLITGWLISRPFVAFASFLWKNAKKIQKKFKQSIANKRKKVYNKHRKQAILREAALGFLSPMAQTDLKRKEEEKQTEHDGKTVFHGE